MSAIFDALGEDEVCAAILAGVTLTALAAHHKASKATLLKWIEASEDRSARVREARRLSASTWDDKATAAIEAAGDPFELARAKELAHHYRWRASKIAPREYGDKVQQEHSGSVGVTIAATSTDETL